MAMGDSRSGVELGSTARRLATYSGILAAVVAFGVIFLTTTMAPWFSWPANALSDLGNPDRWALFWIYNYGLIATGALGAMFVLRSALASENLAHWASSFVMMVTMVDLAMVGVFHAGRDHHGLVSTIFFVSLTYGVMLYGTGDVMERDDRRGLALIWLGIFHVTQWALWDPLPLGEGVAIPEFVGAIVVVAWMALVTRDLLGERTPSSIGGSDPRF